MPVDLSNFASLNDIDNENCAGQHQAKGPADLMNLEPPAPRFWRPLANVQIYVPTCWLLRPGTDGVLYHVRRQEIAVVATSEDRMYRSRITLNHSLPCMSARGAN